MNWCKLFKNNVGDGALQVLDDYLAIHGDRWRQVTEDSAEAAALLEPALAKYQVADLTMHDDSLAGPVNSLEGARDLR